MSDPSDTIDATDTPELVVTETIHAPAETVFELLTDPDQYVRWMGTTATLDPRPGGTYRTGIREGLAAAGEFTEVDPPRRLVFTWGWEGHPLVPPGSSTVEVVLTEQGGVTTVTLTHSGLPSSEEERNHGDGWELYLGRLAVVAVGGDPGPDPNATAAG